MNHQILKKGSACAYRMQVYSNLALCKHPIDCCGKPLSCCPPALSGRWSGEPVCPCHSHADATLQQLSLSAPRQHKSRYLLVANKRYWDLFVIRLTAKGHSWCVCLCVCIAVHVEYPKQYVNVRLRIRAGATVGLWPTLAYFCLCEQEMTDLACQREYSALELHTHTHTH